MLGICFSFYISIFFFLCIIFVILFKKLAKYKIIILYILLLLIIASLYGSIRLDMYNNAFNNIDEITVTGEVLNLEKETEMNNKYIFKVKNYYMYLYISKNINLDYGDILTCIVNVEKPLTNSNEGTFNNRNYMYSNNLVCTVYVREICSIEKNGNNMFKIINNVKKYLITQIEKCFNEKDSSLIKVMLLNDNSNINKEVKELFYNTGLAHILVPSSTHLTYILFMVSFLLSMFNIKSRTKLIITAITIFIYLVITNFAVSIMRILLMFIISNIFSFYIIKVSTLNKICLALLILLLLNPLSIFSVGLLLSFGSVVGILLFNKKIYNKCNYIFNKNNNNVLSKIIMVLSITLSVNILISPIVLCNFNKLYLLGIISNIFIIPLSGLVIVLTLILFIFLNIPIISNILICFLSFLIQIMFGILDYFNGLPLVSIPFVTLNTFEICMYYFCVIDIFVTQKYIKLLLRQKKIIAFIVVISILYSVYIFFRLEIDFIDVGQGDSAYISTFGQKILIDGGGIVNSDFDVGERIIMPFLLNKKVLSLDYVIVTHFDYDHYGGLIYLINNFSIKNIV
ncbi:MAG: ComEC/Rec2 family competence protein, partial [Clostridia bacterium]|nr:ComEC/Rec2 family competence protein [Clostridia bacterium]